MGEEETHQVFISYARQDSNWVYVAVSLLRAGGAKVFMDVDDIEYGDRWKDVLQKSIAVCRRVLVFWSSAAASSRWVNREWVLALQLQKRVVPVSLDDTPLPPQLAELHGLPELKELLNFGAERLHSSPSLSASTPRPGPFGFFSRSIGRTAVAGGVVAMVAAATLGVLMWPDSFSDPFNVFDRAVAKVLVWPWIGIVTAGVIAAIGSVVVIRWRSAKRARLRDSFKLYMNPDVVEELRIKSAEQELGRRFVSSLFAEE